MHAKKTSKKALNFKSQEFRDLQLKWYEKLDKTGFDDIERTGKNRATFYNEYSGILSKPLSVIRSKLNSFDFIYYQSIRQFSFHSRPIPQQTVQQLEITLKRLKENKTAPTAPPQPKKHQTDQTVANAQSKPAQKLTTVDRCILRMIGNGATVAEVSKHLRTYYGRWVDHSSKRGPSGSPYSVYFVHTRFKYLELLCKVWCSLGQPDKITPNMLI